jgi:hypothetical protein
MERDCLEYRGVGGRMIRVLKYFIKEIVCKGVNWIDLAQDPDKWWPLLNTVLNFRDSLSNH